MPVGTGMVPHLARRRQPARASPAAFGGEKRMNIKVTSSFDVQKILDKCGMGKDKRLRKYLGAVVLIVAAAYIAKR